MGTLFAEVYNCFLNKITDDMYVELTPEDTRKDLQRLLINSIPGFEFPRKNLFNYKIDVMKKKEETIVEGDFVLGIIWEELEDNLIENEKGPFVLIDNSQFEEELTPEEINILALLMKQEWTQRQVTSIENTRMKYSGADFKMTSQANHLAKLLNLLEESRRDSFHMQRLYKRRKTDKNGIYRSEWYTLRQRRRYDRE